MSRIDGDPGQFSFSCCGYTVKCTPDGLPLTYDLLKEHARLVEEFQIREPSLCCLEVFRPGDPWPFLIVAQSYFPHGMGWEPGALLVPEKGILFIGAGSRLLAYDLEKPARLWEDKAECGFYHWARFSETVLMSAETEFAAWDTRGKKLWSTFVEPPWEYQVRDGRIELDVMGKKSTFGLIEGPSAFR